MIHLVRKLLKMDCPTSKSDVDQLKAQSARLTHQLQEERVHRANTAVNRDHWRGIAEEFYQNCLCRKRRKKNVCGSCAKFEKETAGE